MDDVARLTTLLEAIRALEDTADRIERSGQMLQYPPTARAMAEEHRVEARELWRKGIRPAAGTRLPSRTSRGSPS